MGNLALAIECPPLPFVLVHSLVWAILQTCDGVAIENERDIFLFYGDEVLSLNIISISYSLLFALICSVLAYFIYFKILLSTGAGNLLICTIIIPPSAILLNAIVVLGVC